jgi:serine/threonine-protein kinase
MAKIARAVHYAHQRGILFRDIKPQNILLDAKGEPYLTDNWGLATRMDWPDEGEGGVVGTPGYMSPEQAQGRSRELTAATDIWGLGATLYYLLTGQPPFQRMTPIETMHAVVHDEPLRPRALNPRADVDLGSICLKNLEKDPQRRYPSAEALAHDLELWLRAIPIGPRPAFWWLRTLWRRMRLNTRHT